MQNLIEIVLKAKPEIRKSAVINALWIEGSYATGLFNESSDIDVWLDIKPQCQERALSDFKTAVERVVTLRQVTDIDYYSIEPKLAKVKLYIKGMSEDNRIELDMQESTRQFVFDQGKHDILTLFDKTGAIKWR